MMNNILVVGSGAREHAILKSLCRTIHKHPQTKLYCFGNNQNPGIMELVQRQGVEEFNSFGELYRIDTIVSYAISKKITTAIIGPEKPLSLGLVDALQNKNIQCIGPTKEHARIETSKSFMRELLIRSFLAGVTVNSYKINRKMPKENILKKLLKEHDDGLSEFVIKRDGLCGGKGVFVQGDHFKTLQEGFSIIVELLKEDDFVLIEEKIVGEEFSYMTICDGHGHYAHTFPIKDYKRVYDGNKGPNTGSMGSISFHNHLLPFLTEADITHCKKINEIVAHQLQLEGKTKLGFRGILYGSFMKTTEKIKIIEYNARFGDPEGIHILKLLENDFITVCNNIISGTLRDNLQFKKESVVSVYSVPIGYPLNPIKNHEIYIHNVENKENIYFGGVHGVNKNNELFLYETGSRSVLYSCAAENLSVAREKALEEIQRVDGPLFFRTDIGLIEEKQEPLTYKSAGVDIESADRLLKSVKKTIQRTYGSNVISDIGGFGGVISIPDKSKNEYLVASIDGIGTKVELVKSYLGDSGFIELGHDIVSHSVNDILVQGAKPLFFMDYIGTSKLNKKEFCNLLEGISSACVYSECCLLGGETAEMPGTYHNGKTDVVGTIVGIVSPERIIDGKKNICVGDNIYGLCSSGPHTNGYTLIRKILETTEFKNKEEMTDIYRTLCKPHTNYSYDVEQLYKKKYTYTWFMSYNRRWILW